jgi:spermidine synthase
VKTFIDVFPHATLWYVEGHMLLIAKLDSELIDYPLLARKFEDPNVREDLASIDIRSPEELLEHLVMGPDQIRAFVDAETDVPLNTDDFPYLEYFVPGDLFARTRDNVLAFARYLSDPATLTRGLPPGSRAVLDQLTAKRMEWILGDPAVID